MDVHAFPSTITRPASAGDAVPAAVPWRRTRIFALPEARWAAAALGLFLAGLPPYLFGAPVWVWGPLFGLTYATGGWEPGWAGLRALRAAAHTGIAMGGAGSDLALQTADAVVVRDELAAVPAVVALSRRARRLVVQNLVVAALFITGLVGWDLAGTLPPPLGVAGHEGSTVIVGLNGLRLLADIAWRRAQTGNGG